MWRIILWGFLGFAIGMVFMVTAGHAQPTAGYAQQVGGGYHGRTVRHHPHRHHRHHSHKRHHGAHLGVGRVAPAAHTAKKDDQMTRTALAAVVVTALAAPAGASPSYDALKVACAGDAMQLCATSIPQGIPAIKSCMQAHWSSVSATCKAVAAKKGEPYATTPVAAVPKPAVVHAVKATHVVHLPKINPATIVSERPSLPSTKQESSMDWADLLVKGAALLGAGVAVWNVGKYGLAPVWAKLVSLGAVAKADFSSLEARVGNLETATGVTPPPASPPPAAKAVAKAPVKPVVTAAPAAPAVAPVAPPAA
jgi:hypothetical protein